MPQLLQLRAHTYVVMGFAFCFRANSQTDLQFRDISLLNDRSPAVLLRSEKSRGHLPRRSQIVDVACAQGLLPVLLQHYTASLRSAGVPDDPSRDFFQLPGEQPPSAGVASTLASAWIDTSLRCIGVEAEYRRYISGHSIRIGSTSAAAVCGVSTERLVALGMRSARGGIPPTYLRGIACEDAALFFFGHLVGRSVPTPLALKPFLPGSGSSRPHCLVV
jgi:hypothetical protein